MWEYENYIIRKIKGEYLMAVRGCTFHRQKMTSEDWAHQVNNYFSGTSSVTKGCKAIIEKNIIKISEGYFLVYGRLLHEDGTSEIVIPNASETQYCVLVYEIDLSLQNTDEKFNQGKYKIITNKNSYSKLVQENLDEGGKLYQFPFCSWLQTVSAITDFRYIADTTGLAGYTNAGVVCNKMQAETVYKPGDFAFYQNQLFKNLVDYKSVDGKLEVDNPNWENTTLCREIRQLSQYFDNMRVKAIYGWFSQDVMGMRSINVIVPLVISTILSSSTNEYNASVSIPMPKELRPTDTLYMNVIATVCSPGNWKATYVGYQVGTGMLDFNISGMAQTSNYSLKLHLQIRHNL